VNEESLVRHTELAALLGKFGAIFFGTTLLGFEQLDGRVN